MPDTFLYIDLESVVKGELVKNTIIDKCNAPSRAQRVVAENDILFQTVRPYQQNNYFFAKQNTLPTVASTGYAQIRTVYNPYFLYTLLHTKRFLDEVIMRCTGLGYPAINSNDLGEIEICLPEINEQTKIAELFSIIDKRLIKQRQLIELLKSYKRGLLQYLFNSNISNARYENLGNLCDITTGKLDANANDPNGIYPFFTCGKSTLTINKYSFDAEAILISGNGDIGQTKYYKGKFDAYQRTYVLTQFKLNAHYIQYAIDNYLPKKIFEETQGGAMPYIKLATLSELKIPIFEQSIQYIICKALCAIDKHLTRNIAINEILVNYKNGLLQQLFI